MKIAILGNGKEGQATREYFGRRGAEITIFENFQLEEIAGFSLADYDLVFRSPSVRPLGEWTSGTKYFFEHCPAPIIGVTGTKGKGTTCSLIKSVLEALGKKVWLVGNIGVPALSVLDEIKKDDVVVYEMSSFQLWDMKMSPKIAVVLGIEPDHLNIHKDMAEYVAAKANIVRWQDEDDICVYNSQNAFATEIANLATGDKLAYPVKSFGQFLKVPGKDNEDLVTSAEESLEELAARERGRLDEALGRLSIVGQHNRENAEAALMAVASLLHWSLAELLDKHFSAVCQGLKSFSGLPHRLELVRELRGVKYYDDNFATGAGALKVAISAFSLPTVLILGGRDKTDYKDLDEIFQILTLAKQVKKIVLIGESGRELGKRFKDARFITAASLDEAVIVAQEEAEKSANQAAETKAIVLMSPAAASFDMFKDVYDRGAKFQNIVRELR